MEQEINNETSTLSFKPRKAIIAIILSLFLPGLGQIYNGHHKKGLLFFGLVLLIPFIFGITRMATSFYGFSALFIIEMTLRIYIIFDAFKNAKLQKEYILKPYNTWYYHVAISIGMLLVLTVYDMNSVLGVQSLKIPTIANSPTIQLGDLVVADTKAYENKQADYGDMVLFSHSNGQIYTYRVVGLPNDKIELINNIVSINGKPCNSKFIKETTIKGIPVNEFEEELPNGKKHLIYKFEKPFNIEKTNFESTVIPADSYFLLGDNRDNAADSRYEGFISKDRIKGQIMYSYWGETGIDRMNISFTER